jgi:hypothetical protein
MHVSSAKNQDESKWPLHRGEALAIGRVTYLKTATTTKANDENTIRKLRSIVTYRLPRIGELPSFLLLQTPQHETSRP